MENCNQLPCEGCCHGSDVIAVRNLSVPVVEVAIAKVQVPSVRRRVLS